MGDFPTRILLATDGSEGAELVASRAVELAQRTATPSCTWCMLGRHPHS